MNPPTDLSALDIAQQVDERCDQFEADWKADLRPRIEDYITAAAAEIRGPLLRALLAVEIELLERGGSAAAAETYLQRFPVDRETIEDLFSNVHEAATGEQTVSLLGSSIGTSRGPAREIAPAEQPQQIGRFRILSELGRGAFGTVYRACDPQLHREVALKVPHAESLRSPADQERFLREARSAAKLNHPNVCTFYEVGEADGRPYIVMALVEGQSLAQRLKLGPPISEQQALAIAAQIALALDEAHRKGIVHRDLKPANIMLSERGEPVIMDFGLARCELAHDIVLTASGTILGTPAYMSPEQARGDGKNIGPPADIYSLGVLLYELLCGRRPFEGTFGEVIGQILHVEPPSPSRYKPGISRACETVCLKAMSKQSAERYASMGEFAAAIEACREQTVARPTLPPRRRWLSAAGLLGLLVLLGVIVFLSRTPSAVVTIVVADVDLRDPSLSFRLDEKPISSAALMAPIELKLGKHELLVKRGSASVKHLRLDVHGGRNPGIRYRELGRLPPPPVDLPPIDPQPIVPIDQPSADRRAAERLSRFAWLRVMVDGRALGIERGSPLPAGDLHLLHVVVEINEDIKDEDLAVLAGVQHLQELKLIDCRRITDAGLDHLAGLTKLRWLVVQNSRISDRGIQRLHRLTNLEGLVIGGTEITDEGLRHIAAHKKLLALDVGRTRITDAGLVHLSSMKQLLDLALYDNPPITDAGLAALRGLTDLEKLQVQGTSLTDAGVEEFRHFKWLKHLDIGQSAVTDASLPIVAGLSRLERLFLQRSRVTGAGLDHLQELTQLEKLSLQGAPITSAAVAPLCRLESLRQLDLYHTSLTAADFQRLRTALPKCQIEPAAEMLP